MNEIVIPDTAILAVYRGKKENEACGIAYRENLRNLIEETRYTIKETAQKVWY